MIEVPRERIKMLDSVSSADRLRTAKSCDKLAGTEVDDARRMYRRRNDQGC